MLNLKKIEIETRGKQATIWLNQPEIRNALNPLIITELIQGFNFLEQQNEIVAIVIRGRGTTFCAGADLNWMKESGSLNYASNYQESERLSSLFQTIFKSGKIVINLVHGHSYGGSLGLIGAADFSLALKETIFGLPEVQLGLFPSVVLPYLLTKAKLSDLSYYMLTGVSFTAVEAKEIGLINNVCSDMEDMELKTGELLDQLFSASPIALIEGKKLMRTFQEELMDHKKNVATIESITRLKMSEEANQRMKKFIQKKQNANK